MSSSRWSPCNKQTRMQDFPAYKLRCVSKELLRLASTPLVKRSENINCKIHIHKPRSLKRQEWTMKFVFERHWRRHLLGTGARVPRLTTIYFCFQLTLELHKVWQRPCAVASINIVFCYSSCGSSVAATWTPCSVYYLATESFVYFCAPPPRTRSWRRHCCKGCIEGQGCGSLWTILNMPLYCTSRCVTVNQ